MSGSIQKQFLIISSLFGLVYIFIVPPFQAPDEAHHFYRVNHLTEGHPFGIKTTDQRFGGELPKSLFEVSQYFRPLRYHPERKVFRDSILKVAQTPLNPQRRTFLDFPNVAYYAPMGYLPQTLGVKLGRLFKQPVLRLLYLGRLFNLVAWIFLLYAAINLFPFHQRTIAYLALLPASLFFHSGINPDAITHGALLLTVGWVA